VENSNAVKRYFRDVQQYISTGEAREHAYRPSLQNLLKALFPDVLPINEPKHLDCGAPDFVIKLNQTRLGHIETKDVDKSLDKIEKQPQIQRYLDALPNLVLTNYLEFRWYVEGKLRTSANLAILGAKRRCVYDKDGAERVFQLLTGFVKARFPKIESPKELATRMAATARLIGDAIVRAVALNENSSTLEEQLKSFQQFLLPDLKIDDFADMYAQTICYGLFAAKCNMSQQEVFSRNNAAMYIPKTNPFLRGLFDSIAGANIDDRISWAVDDLVDLLNRSDMEAILRNFGRRTRQEDPVVHFYETFLAKYDPERRKARGTYYTPEPVVSYIVRSVDQLLRRDFDLEGLADERKIEGTDIHKVQILDPATGTGTFLHSIIDIIYESFQLNKGMWTGYVSEHLLPRLYAFELMMAPYAVAHMKLGLQLKETGYTFKDSERLRIYLTNALERGFGGSVTPLPFAKWLEKEANEAGIIKHDAPVMVIVGNPPYAGHSENNGQWITSLLHGKELNVDRSDLAFGSRPTSSYFQVDGHPLKERNPKWLNDDYVKFIRFAQWRIEKTGHGILAFVTNHGYLDNPTFRGMRQSLMQSFDEIYILDLHGSSKKKEKAPHGLKDENIFDIQQGVAIGIFVKREKYKALSQTATIYYAELWGPREEYQQVGKSYDRVVGGKYHWLAANDVTTTEWIKLIPETPFYLFVPQNTDLWGEYESGKGLTEIMPVNVLGFQTHRDHFAIDIDRNTLILRIKELREDYTSNQEYEEKYHLSDNRDWKLARARQHIRNDDDWQSKVIRCLYRPFDQRYCYFSDVAMDYPRKELKQHMLRPNISLNITRQTKAEYWRNAIVANTPTPALFTEIKDGSNVFPLYLYPSGIMVSLGEKRQSNFTPDFIKFLAAKLGMRFLEDGRGDLQQTFGPEDIFNYIYAIFYSPTYRERYAKFLKTDFPRIPFTSDINLFQKLCESGTRLIELHLMEKFGQITTRFPESGSNLIEKVSYTCDPKEPEKGRVWINKTQYIEGVPPEVWEFHVGGYQVCEKWLKDRKGRQLSFSDLQHYQRIVAALAETITLMEQIDEVIEEHGGWPIQ